MPRTAAALLERSLQIVDVVGSGQAAAAEDMEFARDALVSLLEELRVRDIAEVYFDPAELDDDETIPDELFNPLADLLAVDLSTTFKGGRVSDDEREGVINRIRRITYLRPSYDVQQTEYF